ncbi:MAG: N-acetylmuramoyl-L-alanine amidase [Nocardioides sp.]
MARSSWRSGAAVAAVSLVAGGLAVTTAPQAVAVDWSRCTDGPADRQQVFARAASVSGVPEKVLLAVSYLESRWEDHGAELSTSGGYGPMHLTLRQGDDAQASAKGETPAASEVRGGTLVRAAELTGMGEDRLRSDDVANICGGAAVLASYQPRTTAQRPQAWSKAVALYAGAADETSALRFTRQVFDVLRTGEQATTEDGEQVVLAATPGARVDVAAVESAGLLEPGVGEVDCPVGLDCEVIEAPYEWYGEPEPTAYGNHDLADRPNDLSLDYIIIHNTEGHWNRALELVTDPTYLSWHYTLRSSDGHIAQHLPMRNVGWHAGNWYVNMHSIGLEHEGIAAQGATWFTESMYRTSASLVRHLATKYDIPMDRAHIIGHDQVPGHIPSKVRGMHWDTGPFWDWEHYMSLVGAPIKPDRRGRSNVVTVAPGFHDNAQKVTGCESDGTCDAQGSNFVYLRTEPRADAPLVKDIGLRPDGSSSTTHVSDIGARAAAGQKFEVAQREGDWLGVWWLGDIAWIHSPKTDPVVLPSQGAVVEPAGDAEVPVYGRAYPESSAYPAEIRDQGVVPLQYTLKPGQAYVLADDTVSTDYYYAKTFDDSLAGDHTVVRGDEKYYQIWFGHRIAYVKASDVQVRQGVR